MNINPLAASFRRLGFAFLYPFILRTTSWCRDWLHFIDEEAGIHRGTWGSPSTERTITGLSASRVLMATPQCPRALSHTGQPAPPLLSPPQVQGWLLNAMLLSQNTTPSLMSHETSALKTNSLSCDVDPHIMPGDSILTTCAAPPVQATFLEGVQYPITTPFALNFYSFDKLLLSCLSCAGSWAGHWG